MARNYKPKEPFSVPMILLIPTMTNAYGVNKKTYPDPADGVLFFGSFRTFGGTESISNNVYTVIATATIDTWYNPAIQSDCQIFLPDTGQTYELVSEPEDIDLRHQYMQFKVQKVGGRI